MGKRQLVVNADDFGFTPMCNEGIIEAHRRGILTATTLMANGAPSTTLFARARETPVARYRMPLSPDRRKVAGDRPHLPTSVPRLVSALARRDIRPYDELRAQIEKILDAGIRPTHLDTHKHTHLAPPVLDAVARLSEEFGIRWVRRPFDFPLNTLRGAVPMLKRMTSDALGLLRSRVHRVLESHGCRTTDHFAGFLITGRFHVKELVELISKLPKAARNSCATPAAAGKLSARRAHA